MCVSEFRGAGRPQKEQQRLYSQWSLQEKVKTAISSLPGDVLKWLEKFRVVSLSGGVGGGSE